MAEVSGGVPGKRSVRRLYRRWRAAEPVREGPEVVWITRVEKQVTVIPRVKDLWGATRRGEFTPGRLLGIVHILEGDQLQGGQFSG